MEQPLLGMTIGEAFDVAVARWGARTALVVRHQGIRLTYAELAEQVGSFAAGLLSHELKPDARIGIWSPNCADWVVAQLAAAKAALIPVVSNPACRPDLEYVLHKVRFRALITTPACRSSDRLAMLADLAPGLVDGNLGVLHVASLPHLRALFRLGSTTHAGAVHFETVQRQGTPEQRRSLIGTTLQCDDPTTLITLSV